MSHMTIIDVGDLAALVEQGRATVFDCRFDLADPAAGRAAYQAEHIPGARWISLDADLAGAKTRDSGRHPLPDRDAFARRLAALGLNEGRQVVAYDASGGIFAARLWWMLRWLGHAAVAVVDGGWQAWVQAGLPIERGEASPPSPGSFAAGPALVDSVATADVAANLATGDLLVVDARAPDRFAGAPDPLDPVWGHIPGAANRFYRDNLDEEGRFKPADQLAREWRAALGTRTPERLVSQCGSGVTAAHNLLALAIAGLPGARLYPGSWSAWIADPTRPIATGPA
jgi:thiosulfate/3-mercaptopyruvate sulfurtransferase